MLKHRYQTSIDASISLNVSQIVSIPVTAFPVTISPSFQGRRTNSIGFQFRFPSRFDVEFTDYTYTYVK